MQSIYNNIHIIYLTNCVWTVDGVRGIRVDYKIKKKIIKKNIYNMYVYNGKKCRHKYNKNGFFTVYIYKYVYLISILKSKI